MAGFYIHSAIHHARPEVEAAGHCHSLHGKAWSAFGRPVDITTQDSCLFYDNQAVYHNFGGIVSISLPERCPGRPGFIPDRELLGPRRGGRRQHRQGARTA
jgi:ribulose-5-phosphate 4-epimerase/fuculose-1-phosphate aldolase